MAKIKVIGSIPSAGSIVVGAWDPLFNKVEVCLKRLLRRSRRDFSLELVPVILDPPPAAILNPLTHPRFECADARVARMMSCGIEGIIQIRLSRHDLDQGIDFFLDLVQNIVHIEVLFLGRYQSLGSGGKGDTRTIHRVCANRQIDVECSGISSFSDKREMYSLYARHAYSKIEARLGRPLSWCVNHKKQRLPLRPGNYIMRAASTLSGLKEDGCYRAVIGIDADGRIADTSDPVLSSKIWIAPSCFRGGMSS